VEKKYVLGIDGGGTKSHLAVFDRAGQFIALGKHGPLNHEVLEGSFAQLEQELSAFILETLNGAGITPDEIAFAVMGIAGVDTKKQHGIIKAMVERIGLADFILCNDAFLGVPAGCKDGFGICAINGTGASIAAIDHQGTMVQVGGIGDICNDCGGSTWYGTKLLGAVYGELFKCEPKTVMTEMLFERLGVNGPLDYVESITTQIEEETVTFSELNMMFFDAVSKGDPMAISFLQESAEYYAGGIAHLAMSLDFPADKTLYLTVAGSVFVKEKTRNLLDLLEAEIKKRLPGRSFKLNKLETVPVSGAAYWASKEAGFLLSIDVISKSLAS